MSLSHQQAQSFIEHRLDGPLPQQAQEQLRQHLDQCGPCRAYEERATVFHQKLSRSLPALWPLRKASGAELAEALAHIERHHQKRPRLRPLRRAANVAATVALVLAIFFAASWLFTGDEELPENDAFYDGFFQSPELAEAYVAVHLEVDTRDLPGEGIDIYYPICDGVEYIPPAGALFRKLLQGEPLPECELRPSKTIFLAPGEAQEILFVYSNTSGSPVRFRFVPTTQTEASYPLAMALCGAPGARSDSFERDCTVHEAPPRGLWARYFTFAVPVTARPGSHVNVTARIQAIEGEG